MTSPADDDALSWDGDDDPTLDVRADAPRAQRGGARESTRADAATAPAVRAPLADDEAAPAEQPALGNVALVGLGLLAGACLFFAIGWFIAGLRLQAVPGLPVAPVMIQAATIAAALAPPVWFATTFALTRHSRTWVRFAWLVAGVLLLVPWPFVFTGALS